MWYLRAQLYDRPSTVYIVQNVITIKFLKINWKIGSSYSQIPPKSPNQIVSCPSTHHLRVKVGSILACWHPVSAAQRRLKGSAAFKTNKRKNKAAWLADQMMSLVICYTTIIKRYLRKNEADIVKRSINVNSVLETVALKFKKDQTKTPTIYKIHWAEQWTCTPISVCAHNWEKVPPSGGRSWITSATFQSRLPVDPILQQGAARPRCGAPRIRASAKCCRCKYKYMMVCRVVWIPSALRVQHGRTWY